ncbi:MAG: hypothetical protein AB7L90_04610 [Hyphomicrobiaceae bacterium]
MKRKKILLITLGSKGDASYNMFAALGDFLSRKYECRRTLISLSRGSVGRNLLAFLKYSIGGMKDVLWADTVVVHVAAAPSIVIVAAARMLMRKVVIFQWDVYPTTIGGVRHKDRLPHRILYKAERACLVLANLIVIPSEDFRDHVAGRKLAVMPLWPQSGLRLDPFNTAPTEDEAIRIAFAGQINELRGLAECVAHLEACSANPVVLNIFSASAVAHDYFSSLSSVRVQQHGMLPREELQKRLAGMHFGLVCLNPLMDQPGFPSKTFDYLASGLPILYFGRPLPAYTSVIEKFCIGVDITHKQNIDLKLIRDDIRIQFERGRRDYIDYAELKWGSIANIC